MKLNFCLIVLGGERLWYGFVLFVINLNGWGGFFLGLGVRVVFVFVVVSDGEGREVEGVVDEVVEELDLMENSIFLVCFEELILVNCCDFFNLFFYVFGESFLILFVCCFMNFYL